MENLFVSIELLIYDENYHQIIDNVKLKHNDCLKNILKIESPNDEHSLYESHHNARYYGTLIINKSSIKTSIINLITSMASSGVWISINGDDLSNVIDNDYSFVTTHETSFSHMSFGTFPMMRQFVSHFDSDDYDLFVDEPNLIQYYKIIFDHSHRKIIIQFEIITLKNDCVESSGHEYDSESDSRRDSAHECDSGHKFESRCDSGHKFESGCDSGHDSGNDSVCEYITDDNECLKTFQIWKESRKYELTVNYSNIRSIIADSSIFANKYDKINTLYTDETLYLTLKHPPLLYQLIQIDNDTEEIANSNLSHDTSLNDDAIISSAEEFEFTRSLDSYIYGNYERMPLIEEDFSGFRLRTVSFPGIESPQHLTKCNVIKLNVSNVRIDPKCKSFVSSRDNVNGCELIDIIINLQLYEPNILAYFTDFNCIKHERNDYDSFQQLNLPFNVNYYLMSLYEYSYQFNDTLYIKSQAFGNYTIRFNELIERLSLENANATEDALKDLYISIENGNPIEPIDGLKQLYDKHNVTKPQKLKENVFEVRRMILTPTRKILLPALPIQQSRLLRNYDADYCIRLMIRDDDLQLLSYSACSVIFNKVDNDVMDFLHECIHRQLSDGVEIGGRIYQVLGASTSQLRDHGMVLYAEDSAGKNVDIIRKEIGDLSFIKNAAKFISRISLMMSQSMGYVNDVRVSVTDDIIGGEHPESGNSYVFSDGCGRISPKMASKLSSAINYSKIFSCYQIRYAGDKGIVALDPTLTGDKIIIRPSMRKFESSLTDMDVLKVSEPRWCYLTRPLITILGQMGVPSIVFHQLLFIQLRRLSSAYLCNCNVMKLIKEYTSLPLSFTSLSKTSIDLTKEPFFDRILSSIFQNVMKFLKNKSRILIPIDKARVMYGVIDETRILEYGEVFVQYTDIDTGEPVIVAGEILVTKYPCMHAGDVRKFKAIDVPELHHIVDCIVFPSNGDRPHPDEMAGSDLDGDEYSVIWYKPLIFARDNNRAMIYPSIRPLELDNSVTINDILDFYAKFICNNNVGKIATAHLVTADRLSMGIFTRICNRLSYKYAVELDYAKTGFNAPLLRSEKPKLFPDFMMRQSAKPSYKSDKILGQLYHDCCVFIESIELLPKLVNNDTNHSFIHNQWELYRSDAESVFEIYKYTIINHQKQFGIETEAELFSCSFTKRNKNVFAKNEIHDMNDLLTNINVNIFDQFNEIFEEEFVEFSDNGTDDGTNAQVNDRKWMKASAWYMITEEKNKNCSVKVFGLPWIVSKYLIGTNALYKCSKCSYISPKISDQLMQTYDCIPIDKEIDYTKHINTIFNRWTNEIFAENHSYVSDFSQRQVTQFNELLNSSVKSTIERYKNEYKSFPSYGDMIMKILQKLADDVENDESYDDNNVRHKLGLLSLIGINNYLKTSKLYFSQSSNDSLKVITLAITYDLAQCLESVEEQFKETFMNYGINDICIRKTNDKHILLCAFGPSVSIRKLSDFIADILSIPKSQHLNKLMDRLS